MSAIIGIYYRNGRPVSERSVQEMLAKLSHRGPDGASGWSDGTAALGHLMLWTTPESMNERLPLEDPAANLVLTADARIDNRDELIPQLFDKQSEASLISDSEIILAGYKKWGQDCAAKFVGDFAFAIWDAKNRTIFCARDHFGVKPFYYFLDDQVFAFATEIKGLFCVPEVPRRLNEQRVADFLAGLDDDKEITAYDRILRLTPGHTLFVDERNALIKSYWELDPSRELRLGSNQEYAEAFREQFTEAVRCRMRSAFGVGSMLSGGLDSSAITCVARNLASGGRPLQTFSAIYDTVKECDEQPFINAVLAQNGVQPNYARPDESTPLEDFDRIVWSHDELIVPGNHFIQWQLSKAVARSGVRVVLDGFDGDTTVSHGTGYLVELARAGRFVTLNREARGYARHFKTIVPGEVFWWYVNRYWLNQRMPAVIKPAWRKAKGLARRLKAPRTNQRMTEFPEIVNPDFAIRIGLQGRRDAAKKRHDRSPVITERQAHHRRLGWGLLTAMLESLNTVGSAHGVEYRFPFFDKRLVEFCLSLPPQQKLNNGWNRMVMRRAMEGILPPEVQWRGGKGNMTANFKRGMRDERAQIEEVIAHPGVIEPYVNVQAVRTAYDKFVRDQAGDSEMLAIWRPISLALWLRTTEISSDF